MSKKKFSHKLILKNSELSFELVVNCLVEICGQNYFQAGQCALITHNKGQCDIFEGTEKSCVNIKDILTDLDLNVELLKK